MKNVLHHERFSFCGLEYQCLWNLFSHLHPFYSTTHNCKICKSMEYVLMSHSIDFTSNILMLFLLKNEQQIWAQKFLMYVVYGNRQSIFGNALYYSIQKLNYMQFYHISERSMLIFLNLSAHLKSIQHNVAFLGTQPFWCGLACPLVRLPALCFSMHPLPIQWPCGKAFWFTTLLPQLQIQFCVFSSMNVPNKLKVPKPFHQAIPTNSSALWLISFSWSVVPLFRRTTEEPERRSCFVSAQAAGADSIFLSNLLVFLDRWLLFVSESLLGLEIIISLTEICNDYSELYLNLK